MKISRNNTSVELTLEEFYEVLQDEERIEEISDLLLELEELEFEHEEEMYDELHPFDANGNIALLDRPTTVNQFIFMPGMDMEYLNELEHDEENPLEVVKRILQRFSSFK